MTNSVETAQVTPIEEEVLTMRELKADDLFKMMPIIGKLDIKDTVVDIFSGNELDGEEDVDGAGVKMAATLAQTVMSNIGAVKHDLNSLLSDLTGKTEKEIGDMSFSAYVKLVIDFFKKPELADFFKSIASLMG